MTITEVGRITEVETITAAEIEDWVGKLGDIALLLRWPNGGERWVSDGDRWIITDSIQVLASDGSCDHEGGDYVALTMSFPRVTVPGPRMRTGDILEVNGIGVRAVAGVCPHGGVARE